MKQARTNTIYNFFEKNLYPQIQNVWENFSVTIVLKSKIKSGSKIQKTKK